jgi:hypothetical protein
MHRAIGKIALAIVFGSFAIALALALSNRYGVTTFQINGLIRFDHITGEVVTCWATDKGLGCVRVPTDHVRPAGEPQ